MRTPRPNTDPNTLNPLYLHSLGPRPFGTLNAQEYDTNFQSLLRLEGSWDSGRTEPYEKNEAVYHHGFIWIPVVPTTQEPKFGNTDWVPWSGLVGRGGMNLASPAAGADIGLAYQTINFDTVLMPPVGCLFDPDTNEFQIDYRGTWRIDFFFTWEHNSDNSGRTTRVRLYNVTTNTPGLGTVIATGRNAEATTFSTPISLPVDAELGQRFRIEIGGGDSYSSVVWDSAQVFATQLGV